MDGNRCEIGYRSNDTFLTQYNLDEAGINAYSSESTRGGQMNSDETFLRSCLKNRVSFTVRRVSMRRI